LKQTVTRPDGARRGRMAVDGAMLILLPVLMAYSLVGELWHEIAGVAMTALFLAHHILNRRAAAALFRGRQTPERLFSTAVTLLLCAVMILLPLSGIAMSRHLFTFLPAGGLAAPARTVHLLASHWGLALMGVHLGQHADSMLAGAKRRRGVWLPLAAALTAVACWGAYQFLRRGLWDYMTLKTQFVYFDYGEPRLLFFVSYLAIVACFAWIGRAVKKLLRRLGGGRADNSFQAGA